MNLRPRGTRNRTGARCPAASHQIGNIMPSLLAFAGGLLVAGVCAIHVRTVLVTKISHGKLHKLHAPPEPQYYASIGAGLVGICLGLVLIRVGWLWLRGPGPAAPSDGVER